MIYILLKYILRYRRNIIEKNLRLSFPEADKHQLNKIKDKYYRHLGNIIVESFLLTIIPRTMIKKYFVYENIELLEKITSSGQNISTISGHFANWEWLSSTPLWSDNANFASLYKPIENPLINKISLKVRSRFGLICIDKNNALRKIIDLGKKSKPYVIAFIADQCPSRQNIHYWLKFLNQTTPVFSGWATMSRKLNNAIVYINITQTGKHKYRVRFELLTATPQQYTDKELCSMYMNRLEKDIQQAPELWLWSHNRWKHEPPKNVSL